jgi:hypothetical protein
MFEFCGHMGLKIVHKIEGLKVLKYKRLGVHFFILTLSFEGVVPTPKKSAG